MSFVFEVNKSFKMNRNDAKIACEGLFDSFKKSDDEIAEKSKKYIDFSACRKMKEDIDRLSDEDINKFVKKTISFKTHSKQDLESFVANISKAASDIRSKIIPLVKQMLQASDSDIENYRKTNDHSKVDPKNKFDVADEKCWKLFTEFVNNGSPTSGLGYLARFSSKFWAYLDDRGFDWILPESNCTWENNGFKTKKDLKDLIDSHIKLESTDLGKSFGDLNKVVCDLIEKKLHGDKYTDLPDGLWFLWHLIDHEVFNGEDFLATRPERYFLVKIIAAMCDRVLKTSYLKD